MSTLLVTRLSAWQKTDNHVGSNGCSDDVPVRLVFSKKDSSKGNLLHTNTTTTGRLMAELVKFNQHSSIAIVFATV
jgi:hypothetical protein